MRKTMMLVACALVASVAGAQMKVVKPTRVQAKPLTQPAMTKEAIAKAKRVSPQEAYKLMNANQAVLVDVRSNDSYTLGHIKGAINIPGSQLLARLRELPPGKTIVTYCACSAEQSSGKAVIELNNHGLRNTAALQGGWHAWQSAGLPTAIGTK
jgi:rhodanese-related sulfurtransferase